MHKDQIELFRKRSKNFLDIAKDRYEKKDWDLTCFMAEQATQLLLKAKILEKKDEFPRIHSIRQLISILNELIEEKITYDRKLLSFLEDAYYNSQYIDYNYNEEDAKDALKIAQDVIKFVENISLH